MTAAVLGCALFSGSAADEPELTGREAEAVALAIQSFRASRRNNPKFYGDLKHYTVFVEPRGRQVDVVFVPDSSPKPPHVTEPYVELGGRTVYGAEVHY